jgi:small subunit ribosomal protein S5
MEEKQRIDSIGSEEEPSFIEKLVSINRVAKVVKGGRRLRFSALVVVGDGEGSVGMGIGKSNEVPEAIRKATASARRNLIRVALADNTIPHEIASRFGASRVFLRPASPGTGVIAGGGVRAVLVAAGVKDVLSKSMGNRNPVNLVKASILALSQLRNVQTEIAKRKGSTMPQDVTSSG